MKTALDSKSILIGAAGALVAAVLSGAQEPYLLVPRNGPVRVILDGTPDPRQAVEIRSLVPYVVPLNKIFVATAMGLDNAFGSASLEPSMVVDGQIKVTVQPALPVSMVELPPLCTAPQGSTVEVMDVSNPDQHPRLWGYLVDA